MSLGMLFAKRDDPASQKLFDGMMNIQLWGASIILVALFSVFFIQQLNLFLGFERECTVTVKESERIDKRRKTQLVQMETDRGHDFSQKMSPEYYKRLGATFGESAEVKTDGLFWTKVVAVKTDKGWETIY
jgi:hypothetical protein